jgi:4-hydroxy-tetrahydrodipicolinate synthase
MKAERFRGTGVAVVTPFNHRKIDYAALGKIIEFLIDNGINYIVSLGSTGEASMIDASEATKILDFTIEKVNSRVPIVAGNFAGNNTWQICQQIKNYNFNGIDALLISSPSYVKPTQEGIFQHYTEIAASTDLPIIIYNVPGRTSSNIESHTIIRLAKSNSQFIAVKEASADLVQCEHIIKNAPDGFIVLSGDDPTALALCGLGGQGVISVIANAYPAEFSSLINHALTGNFKEAQKLNQRLSDIHQWLYIEGNPTGIKAALEIKDLCSREVRLPLVPLSDMNFENLKREMKTI